MSYILDSLKKAEEERQRGLVPDIKTVQESTAREPRRRTIWLYLLLAALIMNAGMLTTWLFFGTSDKPDSVQTTHTEEDALMSKSQMQTETTERLSAISPLSKEEIPFNNVSGDSSGSEEKVKDMQPDQRSKDTSAVIEEVLPILPSGTKESKRIEDSPHQEKQNMVSDKSSVAVGQGDERIGNDRERVFSLKELPLSVRKSLPELNISAYMYSGKPSERLVTINSYILHEGETLQPGITLEEITEQGVILSYNGYRFQLELP